MSMVYLRIIGVLIMGTVTLTSLIKLLFFENTQQQTIMAIIFITITLPLILLISLSVVEEQKKINNVIS